MTVTCRKVAGITVASVVPVVFWAANSYSSSRWRINARPFFSAAANAFSDGP